MTLFPFPPPVVPYIMSQRMIDHRKDSRCRILIVNFRNHRWLTCTITAWILTLRIHTPRKIMTLAALFSTLVSSAQVAASDTVLTPPAPVYSFYRSSIGGSSLLYNGSEYIGSYPGTKGSPFFGADDFTKGILSLDGVIYDNVVMAYDLISDELTIKGYQNLSIKLPQEKVDSFQIEGHLFIRLQGNDSISGLPGGYYDRVYHGAASILVKRKKVVQHGSSAEEYYRITPYNDYYIIRAGKAYRINRKRTLQEAFSDHLQEMKAFWRRNKLNFRKNPEEMLVASAGHYSDLTAKR